MFEKTLEEIEARIAEISAINKIAQEFLTQKRYADVYDLMMTQDENCKGVKELFDVLNA